MYLITLETTIGDYSITADGVSQTHPSASTMSTWLYDTFVEGATEEDYLIRLNSLVQKLEVEVVFGSIKVHTSVDDNNSVALTYIWEPMLESDPDDAEEPTDATSGYIGCPYCCQCDGYCDYCRSETD